MTATTSLRTSVDHATAQLPEVTDPLKVAPKDARSLSKLFFEQLAVLEEGTREYQYARNTLIEMNISSSAMRPTGSAAPGRGRDGGHRSGRHDRTDQGDRPVRTLA